MLQWQKRWPWTCLKTGTRYWASQLALTSTLLESALAMESDIIVGFVDGTTNAINPSEHEYHKANNVAPKDVWEDVPTPNAPVLKPF